MTPGQRLIASRKAFSDRQAFARHAPAGYSTGSAWSGGPMYSDAWGAKRGPSPWQLVEAYKSIIFFCTNMNANRVASTRLRLYSIEGNGMAKPRPPAQPRRVKRFLREHVLRSNPEAERRAADIYEITEHPLLTALDKPDPDGYYDRRSLIDLIVRYVDVVGTAYLLPQEMNDGPPQQLWPLQSQYVMPVRLSNSSLIDYYSYFTDKYSFNELLRFRLRPSLRDPYGAGYSATQAAIEYAGLEDKFVSVQEQILGSGARPSIWVSAKEAREAPAESERRRFEQDLNRQHARGMQGRAIVTSGAWEVHPMTYPPADLAGLDISRYDLERTVNCFDQPVQFFTGETNLANLQAATEKYGKDALQPRCDMVASIFTMLAKRYDERLFFAFDPPTRYDEEHAAKIMDIKLKNGSVTINQANVDEPWPPVPWGDEPWLNKNLLQPTKMDEDREVANKAVADKSKIAGSKAVSGDVVAKADADTGAKKKPAKKAKRAADSGSLPPAEPFQLIPRAHEILATALRTMRKQAEYLDGTLSGEDRYRLLEAIRQEARRWLRFEAEESFETFVPEDGQRSLIGKAAARAQAWAARAKRYIREMLLAGALALLGPGRLSDREMDSIAENHDIQSRYLDGFLRDVISYGVKTTIEDVALENAEAFSKAEFAARAELYGGSAWPSSVNLVRARTVGSSVFTLERRTHIGPHTANDPCGPCSSMEDQGWVAIGTLNAIGESTPCGAACHCRFSYRIDDSDPDVWIAGRGPLDDIAFGATG